MPVYKAQKTLGRAIDSILAQDYPDIEILTVLNGEEDDSPCSRICRSYEKGCVSDAKRIRVFQSDEKGVSAARNLGIENAKGEYIAFLDSDDVMLPGAIGRMVSRMEKDESGLVIAGFERSDKPKDAPRLPYADKVIDVPGEPSEMQRLYIEDFLNMPWNKLYKRECIGDIFPTALSLGEDLCFNLSYIPRIDKISLLQYPVCRYMVDDQAASLSAKKRSDRIFVAMRLYRRANAFFEKLYPDTRSGYEVTRT
ncbi:MAG: glycosyltransferase family 2 protein, partial [Lachnospiraceae bacterium]|nr:glycosyltransferase family 2 protein [Lachnospiraceae bacterium]